LTNGINHATVENAVRKNLEARYPDVWANYLCGMCRLEFRIFPPGGLEQGRKPRRLVDERKG
jgi:hypothetical protein